MNPDPDTRFVRYWWRWCRFVIAAAALWLMACAWLARPLPYWTSGWVGWWTADKWGQAASANFTRPHLGTGVEEVRVDGDPAIRTLAHTWADLGYLPVRHDRLTLAGWLKVDADSGEWPSGFLVCRTVEGDRIRLQVGFKAGRAMARIQLIGPNGDWVPSIELISSNATQLGQWHHLAFSTDRTLNRLTLDGRTVSEFRSDHEPFALARLEVSSWIYSDQGQRLDGAPGAAVSHDELVVFDRPLPPEELEAFAAAGRGGWLEVMRRPEWAGRGWRFGWPTVLGVLLATILVRVLPGTPRRLFDFAMALRKPVYRPIRWVLTVGTAVSLGVAAAMEFQGRLSDAARFSELGLRLGTEFEMVFHGMDVLLQQSRDWWSGHPNANNAEWREWLETRRYPADFGGVIGVGVAARVLPEEMSLHEAEWSRRDGFQHRVQPPPSQPRAPLTRLEGDARLPVVLYVAQNLGTQPGRWLTNGSIVGHDLLHQATNDLRLWSQARRIELALAGNLPRASSREVIAPKIWYGRELTGIRLFLPVVERPLTNASGRLAADAWKGVVFGSVDVRRLVQERLSRSPAQLGFRLTTGDKKGGRIDRIVDTGELDPKAAERPGKGLRYSAEVPFFDDSLWFDLWTTELFYVTSPRFWTGWVGGGGIAVTALVSALLYVQIRARERQSLLLEEIQAANARLKDSHRARARLSRDLHDGAIQSLYAVGLHLQHASRHLGTDSVKSATGLDDGQRLVQDTIVELREFLVSLQEERMAGRTFAETVERLFERLRRTTDVEYEFAASGEVLQLPSETVVELAHVVREAVSNALRHGKPTAVTVSLRRLEDRLQLEVADDGAGFDTGLGPKGGHGLENMRARAMELGGQFLLESSPGNGTRVRILFPAPPSSDSQRTHSQ
jgi:signal transduction histidine kinase